MEMYSSDEGKDKNDILQTKEKTITGKELQTVVVQAEAPYKLARPHPNPETQRMIEKKTTVFKQEIQHMLRGNASNPRVVFEKLNAMVGKQHIGGSEKYFTRDQSQAVDLEGMGSELYSKMLTMDTIKNYALYCLSCINIDGLEMKNYPMLKEQVISAKYMFENGTEQPFMAFGVMQEILAQDVAMQDITLAPILSGCTQDNFLTEQRWLDISMSHALDKTEARSE